MNPSRWLLTLAALVSLGVAAAAASQGTQPPQNKPSVQRSTIQPIVGVEGKEVFAAYCAVCHGKDARGGGPAAAALKVPPADLTTLARRNKGKYDSTAVLAMIKGVSKPSHGSTDMPIWGPVFQTIESSPAESTLRLRNLVEYIGSLQQK